MSVQEKIYDSISLKMRIRDIMLDLDTKFTQNLVIDKSWKIKAVKLWHQLDALHDVEEWDDSQVPASKCSIETLLRTIIALNPENIPGLGITENGNIIGAWTIGNNRLTFEFLPNGNVRWLVYCFNGDHLEKASGEIHIARLAAVLEPYYPSRWFGQYQSQMAQERPVGLL